MGRQIEEVPVQHTTTRPPARPISRFLDAQKVVYPRILREIQSGRKRTHWMWFVFPQLRALSKSETARYYGVADLDEAKAYLDHPVLRVRLAECTMGVLSHPKLMLSHPDNHKLQASMTLFSQVVSDATLPNAVLEKFYGGKPHQHTMDVLEGRVPNEPVRPVAPPTAMGRVEWRPGIAYTQMAMWERPDEPMGQGEVRAFLRRFNLPPRVMAEIVEEWVADQERGYQSGWDSHADSVYYEAS
jgi:uncharacterized protein (DUF1810 family)